MKSITRNGLYLFASACVAGSADAQAARLEFPLGLAIAKDGGIYVSERRGNRIVRIDPVTRAVVTIAGTGTRGFSGDGGPAREAQLGCPDAIDFDRAGNLYIADRCNERIRRIDSRTGIISTVAGNGVRGASANGIALSSSLMGPFYVRVETDSTLLITDTDAHRVRQINLRSGIIRTIAGSGEGGFSGDGGPALAARLARPHVALRARNGDLIIGDSFNHRIRRVDHTTGVIRTIAGSGNEGRAPDNTPALEADFQYFGTITELGNGDLLISEWGNPRMVRLDVRTRRIRVVSDDKSLGFLGGFGLDATGRIIAVDPNGSRVLRIDATNGTVETIIGP